MSNSKHRLLGISLAVVFSATLIVLVFLNATKHTANWIIETDVPNGIGECHYLDGDYSFIIYGVFDGATVSLQKAINPSTSNHCVGANLMKDVSVPGLVGVLEETPLIGMQNAAGYYRLIVSGGGGATLIRMEAAKINH